MKRGYAVLVAVCSNSLPSNNLSLFSHRPFICMDMNAGVSCGFDWPCGMFQTDSSTVSYLFSFVTEQALQHLDLLNL